MLIVSETLAAMGASKRMVDGNLVVVTPDEVELVLGNEGGGIA